MSKTVYFHLSLIIPLIAGTAYAQLPANPWDTSDFEKVVNASQVKTAPAEDVASSQGSGDVAVENEKNQTSGDTVASSSTTETQAQAQTTGTSVALQQDIKNNGTSWRGSGQFGKLDYTGEVTTYGTAQGQEMLAPEVNQHNIKVMLDHMRSLGYKIPESYNDKYANFLADYKADLREAYSSVGRQNNPFDTMFSGMLDVFEEGTGLDIENLLFNSLDLLSKD